MESFGIPSIDERGLYAYNEIRKQVRDTKTP